MNMTRCLALAITFFLIALSTGDMPRVLAQGNLAIEKRMSLSRGKTRTVRGKIDSSTSYVYKTRARKDQRLEARVNSEGGAVTFSIIPPGTQTLENAAGVKEWSGVLPADGEYLIIVAVNSSG